MSSTDRSATFVDLAGLARSDDSSPLLWKAATDDLNLNLLSLDPNEEREEYVNGDVDVLLVAVGGVGVVTVEGESQTVWPGQAVVIPKGTARSIAARGDRFVYLACHRRRGGLQPRPLPRRDGPGAG